MPALEFETCDVFTDRRFGGNPLAVVYGADAMDGAAMQRLAREFALSETVFVQAPRQAGTDAFLRIFTPAVELPFAGHPNVGTAVLLARRLGLAGRIVLDQAAGPVVAVLAPDGAGATVTAPKPYAAGAALDDAAMAACAGLPAGTVQGAALHGCGVPFAVASVADAGTLARAAPDAAAFRTHLPVACATGLLLAAPLGAGRWRVRMFGPLAGVPEDPATGGAAVAFGGALLAAAGGEALEGVLEQGVEMGRPSLLQVKAWREAGAIRVSVGGGVVPVARGSVETDA